MKNYPYPHQPVLYHESLKYLQPKPGGRYIDGTLGTGGHSEGILIHSSPSGTVLGLDLDLEAIKIAKKRLTRFGPRIHIMQSSYADMDTATLESGWDSAEGIILDLGLSSLQLDTPSRGFSFQQDAPLDMRFDPSKGLSAADLLNSLSEEEIADILWKFGDERRSRQIAKKIVGARPIRTTTDLVTIIESAYNGRRGKTHPATRSFQALRIAVNKELENLRTGLIKGVEILSPGSRFLVISFHSTEDRIVKEFFRRESTDCVCPEEQITCTCGHQATLKRISKKPITPSQEEIGENPRARSAKLRVAEKI